MGKSGTVTVTVTEAPPPEETEIQFVVKKPDGSPVANANVDIITKDLPTFRYTKTTDNNGIAKFTVFDICSQIGVVACQEMLETKKWLLIAYIDNSEYGYYKDDASFQLGNSYTITLKQYTKPPEFYIKLELNDTPGSEWWGVLLSRAEQTALEISGLKITKVEGEGTKVITIYFTPPWTEHSPLAIAFSATPAFVLALIVAVVGILGTLILLRWTFGEAAPLVVGGLGLGLIVLGALLLSEKKRGESK
jgi:hypothetical protein